MHEKLNFDERHNVRQLPPLQDGSCVYVDDGYYCNKRGRVIRSADQPRSYLVDASPNRLARNHKFLKSCIDRSFGKEVLFLYHRVAIACKFKIENTFIEKLNVFDLFLRSSSEKITSY